MQIKEGAHTHRNYFVLISGLLLVVCIAVYKFKITYTLDTWSALQESETLAATTNDSRGKLEWLKAELDGIGQQSQDRRNKEELQQILFQQLNAIGQKNQIGITGITDAEISRFENYEVTAFSVELSGNYGNIVKVLQEFEGNNEGMRLASVVYQSYMNRQTKQKQLKATIHVQHLKLT